MKALLTWHDARSSYPRDGYLVLGAITGRYPIRPGETSSPDQDFWLVMPMYFRRVHPVEDTGQVLNNRYLDSDGVVRKAFGADGDEEEVVTHWADLPTLPGGTAQWLPGAEVAAALEAAQQESEGSA